jgi:hypothetical protein
MNPCTRPDTVTKTVTVLPLPLHIVTVPFLTLLDFRHGSIWIRALSVYPVNLTVKVQHLWSIFISPHNYLPVYYGLTSPPKCLELKFNSYIIILSFQKGYSTITAVLLETMWIQTCPRPLRIYVPTLVSWIEPQTFRAVVGCLYQFG